MLSTKSLNLLADRIAPMVADYVQNDQRFLDVIHETVTDGVADALDETDEDMLFEISLMVFERLALVAGWLLVIYITAPWKTTHPTHLLSCLLCKLLARTP